MVLPLDKGLGSSDPKLRASLKPSLPMYFAALPAGKGLVIEGRGSLEK